MPQPIPLNLLLLVGLIGVTVLALGLAAVRKQRTGFSLVAVIDAVENVVGQFLMLGMLYAAALQVLSRYWLSQYLTLPWTEEFSRLLMVWAGLWGAAMVQRADDHINITLVSDLLPAGAQRSIRIFSDVVVLAVLCPVFWLGFKAAGDLSDLYTIAVGMPMLVFAAAVPATVALMIIYTLAHLVRRLRGQSAQQT